MLKNFKSGPALLATVVAGAILFSACTPQNPKKETTEPPAKPAATESTAQPKPTEPAASESSSSGNESSSAAFLTLKDSVAQSIKENWPHMQKVWPTYNYNEHALLLFHLTDEGEAKEAWLIDSKENRKLSPDEWKDMMPPQPGGYNPVEWKGKPSIAMGVDDAMLQDQKTVDSVYRTASHELVHFYYQQDIDMSMEGDRAQVVPIDKTPRLYRQMLYRNLIDAFDHPDQAEQKLGHAKYWLEKWKSEFAEEAKAIHTTDIAEATARYTENFSTFIGKANNDDAIREHAGKSIDRQSHFVSADAESYEIGYVAGLLLDRTQPGWKDNFYKDGTTVEEKLLASVKPVEEPISSELDAPLTAEIDKVNKEAEQSLQSIVAAKNDKKIPYLRLLTDNVESSFGSSGTFRYEGLTVVTQFAARYEAQGKNVEANGLQVIESGDGQESMSFTIPLDMAHTVKDGALTVDTQELKIDGAKVETSEEDGRTVYTLRIDR